MFRNKIVQPAFFAIGAIGVICLLFGFGQTTTADSTQFVLTDPADFAPLLQLEAGAAEIPGQYIVVLKEDPVASRMSTQAIELLVDTVATSHVSAEPSQRYTSALTGFAATLNETEIKSLQADSRVAFIEPDQTISIFVDQNNPTWGLDRIDERDLPLDNNYRYDFDGTGVDIYIIDTGVLPTHNDFGNRVVGGYNSTSNNTADYVDCNGHGTHVAGSAAGSTYGVAKGASIYGVRVLGCNGSGSNSGVIAGIDWVTQNADGPSVANMSLGGSASNAVDQAVQNSIAAGITHVAASGNENTDACNSSPARVAAAITVNASTINDGRASFSNYGTCTDIFAPGDNITSAWYTGNNATVTISGTSMASPHVAGVAALYLAGNGNASPAEVKNAIEANASTNKLSNIGPGSPNLLLYSLIDGTNPLPTPTATPPPTATPSPTPISGNIIFFDDFEEDLGWDTDPNNTDTASTGFWQVASPQGTELEGVQQVGQSYSGSRNLVTGALAGDQPGSFDVDDGVTSVESPSINLPADGTLTLHFAYYLAHYNNSGSDDYLRVEIVGSSTSTVFQELGSADVDNGAWATTSVDISAFVGQTITVLISAADNGDFSLVEAGVDDLFITQNGGSGTPAPPTATPTPSNPPSSDIVFFDDFEEDLGWTIDPFEVDTASTGQWEVANPEGTTNFGPKQLDDTVSGVRALVTGPLAGEGAGSHDVDGGFTIVESPLIELPNSNSLTLTFSYYFAHGDNSSGDDFLALEIFGSEGSIQLSEAGAADDDDAVWEVQEVDLTDFAGQTIQIYFTAADQGAPSLVEAAIDDVLIVDNDSSVPPTPVPTNTPVPPPPTETPTPNPQNQPPALVNPGTVTFESGEFALLELEASDSDGDDITFSATGLSDEFFILPSTGEIFGLPFADGTYDVTVIATDSAQNSSQISFTIIVETALPLVEMSDYLYEDSVSADWSTGIWGDGNINPDNSSPVSGGEASLQVDLSDSISSAYFEKLGDTDLSQFTHLQFDILGTSSDQAIRFAIMDAEFQEIMAFNFNASDQEWRTVTVPLTGDGGSTDAANYYVFKDSSLVGSLYLDNLVLLQTAPEAPTGSGNEAYLPFISR